MNEIELKQTSFFVMGNLFHDVRQYLDQQFKKYDLTRSEWLILAMLRINKEGLSQAFAKSYVGLEASYFTKILNELEEKGYIIREIDPNDRRNRIIKVNPKSSRKIKKFFKLIYDFTNAIHHNLSEKQMLELHKSLNIIAKNTENFKRSKQEKSP